MSRNPRSLLLVFIQAIVLIYLFLSGPVIPTDIVAWTLLIGGLFLGLWAIWTMRVSSLQITPEIASGSVLVSNGPYSFIRHPMYSAVLLVVFGLLFNDFTWMRLTAATVIFIDLILKAGYEEKLLVTHFKKDYEDYKKNTARFLPFVY